MERRYYRDPYRRQHNRQHQQYLLLSAMIAVLGVWFLTPVSDWITDAVLMVVPIEADVELGLVSWKSMKRDFPAVQDRWGVGRIGRELVNTLQQSDADSQFLPPKWSFGVVHADFVNAFALPGGIVRVTDALLQQLNLSDAELAALVGHEMGHVIHRHSQARVLQQRLIGFIASALTYEDDDDYDESFGEAIGELMLKSASFLGQQSFSRKNEYEADATSWDLLVESQKYSPKAVEGLLQKLWDLQGGQGTTSWESTHPGTKDRIKALRAKWRQLSPHEARTLKVFPIK